jgi:hypothetical protein
MAVKIKVMVDWNMTMGFVDMCERFGGAFCLHHQGKTVMYTADVTHPPKIMPPIYQNTLQV